MEKRLFTSESVTEGHPDKICDAISDAILDALLEQDPMSRVACETCTTTGYVMVMGEITSNAHIDFQQVVRDTVREIGYDRAKYGFDADTCAVVTAIDKQSTDIAMGVDKALEAKENNMSDEEIDAIGAGDQGMMFGFATNETEEYMPYPIYMAHKLARQLTKVRKDGTLSYLRPDGKTQVTVEYDENGKPFRLDAVVLSTQHDPEVSQEQIHEDIKKYVFDEIIPADMVDEHTKFFINPTGRFVIGNFFIFIFRNIIFCFYFGCIQCKYRGFCHFLLLCRISIWCFSCLAPLGQIFAFRNFHLIGQNFCHCTLIQFDRCRYFCISGTSSRLSSPTIRKKCLR